MENFFDKFDPPKDGEAEVPMGDPGPEPQLAVPDMPAVPEGGNPFDAIEAAQPPAPEPLSYDEFQVQIVQKLNEGKTPIEDVVAWSQSVGHPIVNNEEFQRAYLQGQQTAKTGQKGAFKFQQDKTGAGGMLDASTLSAIGRGAADAASFNFGDELYAGVRAGGESLAGGDFDNAFTRILAEQAAQRGIDEAVNPTARNVGTALGILPQAFLPVAAARAGTGLGANALRGGAIGAAEGGLSGAGDGLTADQRVDNAKRGAIVGSVVGAGLPIAASAAGIIARPAVDFVNTRVRKTDASAVNALGRRIGIDPARMAEDADALRMAGVNPTTFDVIGETGQDFIGAMGRRPGQARERMQQFADERRVSLPDRVARQAERLSPESRTPDELSERVRIARDNDFAEQIEPLRSIPIELTEDMPVVAVLRTAEGKRAIGDAARLERDPAVKKVMLDLATPPKRNPLEDQIPEALSEAAKAKVRQQLQIEPPEPKVMTLDMADKIARSLNDAVESASRAGQNGRARVLRDYAREVRDTARSASPEYDKLLTDYSRRSQAVGALESGEGFVRPGTTDEFVQSVEGLSDDAADAVRVGRTREEEDAFVAGITQFAEDIGMDPLKARQLYEAGDGEVRSMAQQSLANAARAAGVKLRNVVGGEITPRGLARAGAARAVQRAAGESPRGALTTAERLAVSPEQRARTEALIGPEGATQLGNAMAAEARLARDASLRAPRTGSRTAINTADDALITNAVRGGTSWLAIAGNALRYLNELGISDETADRIVQLAIDPARTDEAVQALMQQMKVSQRRAEFLLDNVRGNLLRDNN